MLSIEAKINFKGMDECPGYLCSLNTTLNSTLHHLFTQLSRCSRTTMALPPPSKAGPTSHLRMRQLGAGQMVTVVATATIRYRGLPRSYSQLERAPPQRSRIVLERRQQQSDDACPLPTCLILAVTQAWQYCSLVDVLIFVGEWR